MGVCYSDLDDEEWELEQKGDGASFEFVPQENRVDDIWTKYERVRKLGEGASCKVYEVVNRDTGEKVAMKQMEKADKWNPILFDKEVDILQSLTHPNILKYDNCYMDRRYFYVCTTFLNGGELFERIKKLKHFDEKQAADVMRTILEAIHHMHSHQIVHRDLKPENIVYNSRDDGGEIVIIDLGDARRIRDEEIIDDFVGTAFYLAPECVRHRKGWELKKSDMWAIGVIAYVLLTGQPPFYGANSREILQKIVQSKLKFPSNASLSKPCKNFILSLIQKDPRRRLSAEQALEHPWIVSEASKRTSHLGDQLLANISNYYDACKLKKLIVHMMVQDMTEEDKNIIRRSFAQLDYDGDGFIDLPELTKFLMTTGMQQEDAAIRAEEMLNQMDEDGDGRIDLREFAISKTAANFSSSDDMILDQFNRLDKDGDGLVDSDNLFDYFDGALDRDQVDALLNEVDGDGDGKITFDEFKTAMRNA